MRTLYALITLSALFVVSTASAQDDRVERAREHYTECEALLAAGEPCRAQKACEKGLENASIDVLVSLTEQSVEACRLEREARKRAARDPEPTGDDRPVSCPPGRVALEDGACCWPGQLWNATMNACVGLPTSCPDGLAPDPVAETCAPPRDIDGDGVHDGRDRCPGLVEDGAGSAPEDGCPEPDADADGFCAPWTAGVPGLDLACLGVDLCENDAEDSDGWEDDDGCPDLDNDKDAIADTEDACPDVWGEAADGCPVETPVEVAEPPGMPPSAIFGWSALGVGGGLLVASAGFFIHSELLFSDLTNAERDPDGVVRGYTQREAESMTADADLSRTLGVAFATGGGLLLATGVVLVLLAEEPEAPVEVSVTRDGIWLEWTTRF